MRASCVEAATSPLINVSGFTSFSYGYLFWLGRSLSNRREVQRTAAAGLGAQHVFVVQMLDLVIVINAGLYKSSPQHLVPTAILNQYEGCGVAPVMCALPPRCEHHTS